MKFRTPFTFRDFARESSPVGSRYQKTYILDSSSEGAELIETGTVDIYDSIQKAANGLKIEDLIRRARAGDSSAIGNPVATGDLDLTGMPSDLLDAHKMLSSARDKFDSLSADKKALFNNSFESFLSSAADGSLVSKLSANSPPSSLTSDELVKIRSLIGGSDNA